MTEMMQKYIRWLLERQANKWRGQG